MSRASPATTVQASVVGWPASPGKLAKWSDAEERLEAVVLGALGRSPAGRRRSSPAGARSSGRSASRLLRVGWTIHLDRMVHSSMMVDVMRTIESADGPPPTRRPRPRTRRTIIADYRATIVAMKCAMSERLVRLGISMAQLNILYTLQRHGEMPMSRLAERPERLALERHRPRRPDGGARVHRAHPRPGGPPGRPRPHHRRTATRILEENDALTDELMRDVLARLDRSTAAGHRPRHRRVPGLARDRRRAADHGIAIGVHAAPRSR